jgi:hypothetical protein
MTKAEAKAKIEEARRTLELLAPEFDEAEPCPIVFSELATHAVQLVARVAEDFPEQKYAGDPYWNGETSNQTVFILTL